jgi:hypothetical protein
MSGQPDRWIEWTTTGCVALPALIAGTVQIAEYERAKGDVGWVARGALISQFWASVPAHCGRSPSALVPTSSACWR